MKIATSSYSLKTDKRRRNMNESWRRMNEAAQKTNETCSKMLETYNQPLSQTSHINTNDDFVVRDST